MLPITVPHYMPIKRLASYLQTGQKSIWCEESHFGTNSKQPASHSDGGKKERKKKIFKNLTTKYFETAVLLITAFRLPQLPQQHHRNFPAIGIVRSCSCVSHTVTQCITCLQKI